MVLLGPSPEPLLDTAEKIFVTRKHSSRMPTAHLYLFQNEPNSATLNISKGMDP